MHVPTVDKESAPEVLWFEEMLGAMDNRRVNEGINGESVTQD